MNNFEKPFSQDTFDRNRLQVELIKKVLGSQATGPDILDWINMYGKHLSDIIDNPTHQDITDLARAGKYEEASEMIYKILLEEKAIAA